MVVSEQLQQALATIADLPVLHTDKATAAALFTIQI